MMKIHQIIINITFHDLYLCAFKKAAQNFSKPLELSSEWTLGMETLRVALYLVSFMSVDLQNIYYRRFSAKILCCLSSPGILMLNHLYYKNLSMNCTVYEALPLVEGKDNTKSGKTA